MTKEVEKLIEVKLRPDDWRKIMEALSFYGLTAFDFGNKKEHQHAVWLSGVIATRIWEESDPEAEERGRPTDESKPIPITDGELPF